VSCGVAERRRPSAIKPNLKSVVKRNEFNWRSGFPLLLQLGLCHRILMSFQIARGTAIPTKRRLISYDVSRVYLDSMPLSML